jgi:hypothetical protein
LTVQVWGMSGRFAHEVYILCSVVTIEHPLRFGGVWR